jgi:hypothetical protein
MRKHLLNTLASLVCIELIARQLPLPGWAPTSASCAVLFLALCKCIAADLDAPELRSVARRVQHTVRFICNYMDRFPNQMLGSSQRNLRGLFCAFGVLLMGVSVTLLLVPAIHDAGTAASNLDHPKQAVAFVAFCVLILLARLGFQAIGGAWRFMRGATR